MPEKIILIAAVTVDGYIARHSKEIIKWSKDLRLFKKQTMGCSVVVGSNTYQTIEKELSGRKVFVVHRNNKPSEILSKINQDKCYMRRDATFHGLGGNYNSLHDKDLNNMGDSIDGIHKLREANGSIGFNPKKSSDEATKYQ